MQEMTPEDIPEHVRKWLFSQKQDCIIIVSHTKDATTLEFNANPKLVQEMYELYYPKWIDWAAEELRRQEEEKDLPGLLNPNLYKD